MDLLSQLHSDQLDTRYESWRPSEPPSLHNVKEIFLDFETTGVKYWAGDTPGGVAYYIPGGPSGYLPWGHACGYNLDRDAVVRWLKDLTNLHITNHSTDFEVHMALTLGVDLEAQGCTVSDIAHTAALLDDHRRQFSLEVLAREFLPETEQKVKAVDGVQLDPSKMMEYPSGMIAVRAVGDVRQVHLLKQVLYPRLEAEDLMRVQHLEDQVIYAVAEMERNALPMDVELLNAWHTEAEQRYLRYLWKIHRETGIKFNPGSPKSWEELFAKLKIEWNYRTPTGQLVTTDNLISRVEHPIVQLARQAGKLADLKSDYIDKYHKTVGADGLLRFALHQLRSDDGGTVTGRFSGAAIKVGKEKIGCNPQQVPDISKQIEKGHDTEFVIRKLFVHGGGDVSYISADAKQIEYRLFADYARNPKIMEAYEKDPDLSFHKQTHAMLSKLVDISYGHQKNVNFMKIYGGGMAKLAFMIGAITDQQLASLQKEFPKGVPRTHPLLAKAVEVDQIYARELPEVKPLLDRASHLARTHCDERCRRDDELHRKYPHQGYVKTLLGRRGRFPDNQRLHKALNMIIQGGAADIMKQKMVEVHRERKNIGFVPRLTNHDEICGDGQRPDTAQKLLEILNTQSFPELRIPILWDVKSGPNWAAC